MKYAFLPLLAAIALLSGCMTEQELRDQRIAENQTVFLQLDAGAQARARSGQVTIGDTHTAVWFAYGEPNKKSSSVSASGTVEVWDYYTSVPQYYYELEPNPPPDPYDRGRRFYFSIPAGYPPPPPGFHYEERTRYVDALKRQFQFVNGLCTLINTY